jgi:hypothetical protein
LLFRWSEHEAADHRGKRRHRTKRGDAMAIYLIPD